MKIAVVTEYYYPSIGGITEHVHHFCTEVQKLGHHPIIITSDAGKDACVDSSHLDIIRVGKSYPVYSNESIARVTMTPNIGKKIQDIFASEKFDLVHTHSPFIPMLPLMCQRYSNTITIGTFHSQFDSNLFLKLFKTQFQKYFDNLHGKIAVSELCCGSINRYLDGGDFRIIPNGIDTNKFNGKAEKISQFNDEKINIFFLSRLEPRNGLEYLIKAFVCC